ncbi:hypothetical protein OS493_022317 [Desmophyllum pertusum]|uniref:Uncharacterized protein n=1 Tax=Desmophyllum pertusum TaxID=174260 RepID=A0A9X0A354_9CNID|nr:hypothetical protein OS493_022317 [Desmophyllum pertusum]
MNKAMAIGLLLLVCVSFLVIEESSAGIMGFNPPGGKRGLGNIGKRRSICMAARALRCNEQEQNSDDNNMIF